MEGAAAVGSCVVRLLLVLGCIRFEIGCEDEDDEDAGCFGIAHALATLPKSSIMKYALIIIARVRRKYEDEV